MGERTKTFTTAVSLTILVVIAARCGSVIWRIWSGVLWIRTVPLLLAALMLVLSSAAVLGGLRGDSDV